MAESPPLTGKGYTQGGVSYWTPTEDTPELHWPLSIAVYDRMRRQDSQVQSVLRAVTLPVRRTEWRIDPNGASPEVVALVAEDLGLPIVGEGPSSRPRTRDRFSFAEHLRLALLMLAHGHSVFEQIYRLEGGRYRLRKLEQRPSSTISAFNVARDGGLISIEQDSLQASSPIVIPISQLVVYTNDREGGNWLGTSLLRPAYKHWLLKDRLLRIQAQTIDRNGMGLPLYKGGEQADEAKAKAELAAGLAMAQGARSGESSGVAISHDADFKLLGVEGTLPDAEPAIRYHDEQIARAVLAHFLNLGSQTGSWALGSTFADFFTLSLQAVAEQVQGVVNQHVIEDLVDINFGTAETAPLLVFDEIGSRQAATAEAIKTLIDAGVIFPDRALEEAVRQAYGLPPKGPVSDRGRPQPPAPSPPDPPQEGSSE